MNKDVCNRLSLSIITQVENELSYFAGVCKENPIRKMRDLPDGIKQFYTEVLNWQDYIPRFRRLLQHNIRMSTPELHESVNPDDFPLTFLPNHRPAMNALIAKGDEAELKDLEYEADSPVKSDLFAHTPPASVKSDFLAYKGATSLKGTEAMQETYPVPQEILLELKRQYPEGNWPISGQDAASQNMQSNDEKPAETSELEKIENAAYQLLRQVPPVWGDMPELHAIQEQARQLLMQRELIEQMANISFAAGVNDPRHVIINVSFTGPDGYRPQLASLLRQMRAEGRSLKEIKVVSWRLTEKGVVTLKALDKRAGKTGEDDMAFRKPKQEPSAMPKKASWIPFACGGVVVVALIVGMLLANTLWLRYPCGLGAIALLLLVTSLLVKAYAVGDNFFQKMLHSWPFLLFVGGVILAIIGNLFGWDKIHKYGL